MLFVGADPGLSGAIAFYWPATGALDVHDMPTMAAGKGKKSARIIDRMGLARIFDREDITHAFIEQVATRPGEGAVGAFTFGVGYGCLMQAVASAFVPVTFVTPPVWKRALRVPAAKDGARARASELLPRHAGKWTRVKDDGRAEAAMIAYWGAAQMRGEAP